MPAQNRHVSTLDGADEDIPAIDSASDSSESEDNSVQAPPAGRLATRERIMVRPVDNDVEIAIQQRDPFFSSTGEDEEDQEERWGQGVAGYMRYIIGAGDVWTSPLEIRARVYEEGPDILRAHVVMDGLEPVSKGLLSRYKVSGGKNILCAVCYELLYPCEDHDRLEPLQTENKKLSLDLPDCAASPDVVAFPCLHLFHSECLFPWLTQNTTCPTCRHDVGPDSLTIKGGNAGRSWFPPAKGKLEAWVQAEEEKRSSCNGSTTPLA